jgi:hypothetical protein
MNPTRNAIGMIIASCLIGAATLLPQDLQAQDPKVKTAMEVMESTAHKLGPPKIDGTDSVAGKEVPAIYFGSTKMNNNFELVDDVVKQAQGTATIFVKSGDEYIRVATNVKKDDGSRAIGTVLDRREKRLNPLGREKPSMEKLISSANLTSPATSQYGTPRKM